MSGPLKGVVWALVSIAVSVPLQGGQVLHLFVAFLGVAVGIYIGGELAAKGSPRLLLVASTGFGFLVLGLFGLWRSPGFLIAAWALHALWDAVYRHQEAPASAAAVSGETGHPGSASAVGIPSWYPSACLVYDLIVAAYLTAWWRLVG